MTDARTALRSLVIYAVCIPLALVLGYLLANPLDLQGVTLIGIVFLTLCAPLLLRYHYPFLLLAWNMGAIVFFLPGRMGLWMVATLLSFGISFTHRILDKKYRFLSVPQLASPLIALAVVVLVTGELRGGIGLRSMGGETMGGRRYVELLVGILGFFALTVQAIPRERVRRYLGLFYLSGMVVAVGILYNRIPSAFNFIFLFIPPSQASFKEPGMDVMGFFRPLAVAGPTLFGYLLARYGLREILTQGRWRLFLLFSASVVMAGLSGSRLSLVAIVITFALQFWLEGLFRTRLPVFIGLGMILVVAVVSPFIHKLPLSIQRTISVLPVKVDPIAEADAASSSEWRKQMWRVVIPQIPQYLLLGKGYGITRQELAFMTDQAFAERTIEDRGALIAGDYHNGPLSVIMPFGIWGVITFSWFLLAGLRVLWRNYRYGASEFRIINIYLLSSFVMGIVTFMFVFGSLHSSILGFTGVLGFSVALNGGVARPGGAPLPEPVAPPVQTDPRKARLVRRLGPG